MKAERLQPIKKAIIAGYPVIAISTWEEDQAVVALSLFSKTLYGNENSFFKWTLREGLVGINLNKEKKEKLDIYKDPEKALDFVLETQEVGFFVFLDLFYDLSKISVQRRIKDIAYDFKGKNKYLFLIGPDLVIPHELSKDVHLIDFPLPQLSELREIVEKVINLAIKRGAENKLTEEQITQAAMTLKGFTASEAQFSLSKILFGKKVIDESVLHALHSEKEQIAKKSGILEYIRVSATIDEVGGLQNLKEWLIKRKKLFSPEAASAGLKPPRGLLMMGISGCGKSLSVKAISHLWKLPLFRLDMNMVYSGMYGSPEAAFHRAIKFVEAVAPAILWIDEIEGGISSVAMKDGSTGSHIFSAFLTWMQEKSSDVFVAATANRIDLLPAEIIRKGRFDQVFFIDLPNDKEREEIFKVHLKKRGIDPSKFDLTLLSVATEYWNGAEIEHVVESALIEAFNENRPLTQDDLYTIIRNTVPLSRTMAEQIKFIKLWASERAISASAPSNTSSIETSSALEASNCEKNSSVSRI